MNTRKFLTSFAIVLLLSSAAAATSGRLCFTRGDYIYVQHPGGRIRRLVKGVQPNISPDGKTIAFVAVSGKWPKSESHVKLLDIQTGKTRAISSLNGFESFHPLWSPDGRQLAVQLLVDRKGTFATVDISTDDHCVIPSEIQSEYIWLNSWMPDGNSVVLNDLENVYQLALDGHVVRKLSIRGLFGDVIVASDTRFSFSADAKFLVFNSAMVPDDVGIASIYLWDLAGQRLSRLTSDRIGALDPKWLPSGNEIIFTGYVKGNYKPKSCIPYYRIYKMPVNGKTPTILMRDAEAASYSTR